MTAPEAARRHVLELPHTFDPLDTEVRDDKTLVYWLHGGLHLYRDQWGQATNRVNGGMNLLDAFKFAKEPALFVSEGTSKRKRRAIRKSDYLEHCYVSLCQTEGNIVVLGHSLSSQDMHLATALRQAPTPDTWPMASFPGTRRQVEKERDRIKDLFPSFRLRFFDSTTHPLGDPRSRSESRSRCTTRAHSDRGGGAWSWTGPGCSRRLSGRVRLPARRSAGARSASRGPRARQAVASQADRRDPVCLESDCRNTGGPEGYPLSGPVAMRLVGW